MMAAPRIMHQRAEVANAVDVLGGFQVVEQASEAYRGGGDDRGAATRAGGGFAGQSLRIDCFAGQ